MDKYFGKYRGTVTNNIDPNCLGRVQVSCPSVLGDGQLAWAMPNSPYAGDGEGFFAIPPIGANVWVEFEGGDTELPIWAGCFWGMGESPVTTGLPSTKMLKTESMTLTLDDLPGAGGFTLEVDSPAVNIPLKMVFDSNGIEINQSQGIVKITPTEITITHDPSSIKISPTEVKIELSPSTLKLDASAIEATCSPGEMKVSSSGVELKSTPAEVKVAASSLQLKNGGSSIAMDAVTVNMNNGALEVM